MIRNILIVLLMSITTSLIAQGQNTYDNFYKSRWKIPHNWAKKDTMILKHSQKRSPDKWEYRDYGEYIFFKENKQVNYERYLSCPVGAIYTTIENFLIFENKVYIYYKTKSWNASPDKWEKKQRKYHILTYDDATMTLVQI